MIERKLFRGRPVLECPFCPREFMEAERRADHLARAHGWVPPGTWVTESEPEPKPEVEPEVDVSAELAAFRKRGAPEIERVYVGNERVGYA